MKVEVIQTDIKNVYNHTMFERNQMVNLWLQANIMSRTLCMKSLK